MLHHAMEEGQGLVEYAFIIVLIAMVVVVSVALLADEIEQLYRVIRAAVVGAREKGLPDLPPVPAGETGP